MILRVFAFIWCANLLTLLLFLVLINLVDLSPPEDIQIRAETRVLEQQVSDIYRIEGKAGALAFWRQIAPGFPAYALQADADCSDANVIGAADQGCLHLSRAGSIAERLQIIQPAALPLTIGALVSAVMAIFLSRWLTSPIRRISQGLKAIAAGHLQTRISAKLQTSNRELQDLGRDFDFAAERLQTLAEGRTRLFHDISHEIRSPLARLRAAVGLIEVSPARGASLAGRMEGDISRLDHLVNEILTLARLERGDILGEFQTFDLLDLVENIIADANFEGRVRNVKLTYSGVKTLNVMGNPELLHRACENIIRNALSHSPQGGIVQVTGQQIGDAIILEVADEGPGVPEANLKNIFAPFVRVEKEIPSAGIGLGLAIASGAITSHGGTILARNRQPNGLVLKISVPLKTSTANLIAGNAVL
ncbi:HAMP domain-containing sensor histidine kinase [Cypionkella psychrotolerans]|uniref:HAMP domain-containing sensor histidine kinase n=1 Tax=Cypionkella psychrotolerans TaxID=1678131 RepID=UPI0006B68CBB|nr:ATP-binding protein [Cypionkella psychrotolerans]